jgi:hypothetical protein
MVTRGADDAVPGEARAPGCPGEGRCPGLDDQTPADRSRSRLVDRSGDTTERPQETASRMTSPDRMRSALRLVGVVAAAWSLLLYCPAGAAAQSVPLDPPPSRAACGYGPTRRMAQARESAIREASALVASQQWPGIYWTFNDSGNAPTLYAIDDDGQPRGTFQVAGASNSDWETLQLGPDGDGGYALYIGDSGDNKHRRRESVIYRVREPEPGPAGEPAPVGTTAPARAFRFAYPVAARNVEAMLVHPITGEIVLVSQGETGFSMAYRLPLPLSEQSAAKLELTGVLDARALGASGGQVTDATVSSDARHVAVRTYSRVLVYNVPNGASLARIWNQEPRVNRLDDGAKGEGITYRSDSFDLVSIGEGAAPFLYQYQTDWRCGSVG